ncbi:hypothetical protein A9K55_007099 [Cordyceps militaris]|uniref:Uncharacterized protein n=1 Tax=Cordyceps militaris TaxID=73501 RepID=A0A2H4SFX9_CORMI|nr:hypothetical protein A9K55_007099 [Cordyceps militaris]
MSAPRQQAAQRLIDLLEPLTRSNDDHRSASGAGGTEPSILGAIQDVVSALASADQLHAAFHDGKTHYPLRGGSYAFRGDLVGPLLRELANDEASMAVDGSSSLGGKSPVGTHIPARPIVIHAGAQPNNSPHLGTLIVFSSTHHIRITGADYAGTYQEVFLYRPLVEWSRSTGLGQGRTPHILYAPLVVDWSGAKLSKSLDVGEGGYRTMETLGMGGLCSYANLKSQYGEVGLRIIWAEVESWFANPHKLFRASYSVEYFRGILQGTRWQ